MAYTLGSCILERTAEGLGGQAVGPSSGVERTARGGTDKVELKGEKRSKKEGV